MVDGNGGTLPPDTPGELLVKGPTIMAGYWGKPKETLAAIDADGWFRTGMEGVAIMRGCNYGYWHWNFNTALS